MELMVGIMAGLSWLGHNQYCSWGINLAPVCDSEEFIAQRCGCFLGLLAPECHESLTSVQLPVFPFVLQPLLSSSAPAAVSSLTLCFSSSVSLGTNSWTWSVYFVRNESKWMPGGLSFSSVLFLVTYIKWTLSFLSTKETLWYFERNCI